MSIMQHYSKYSDSTILTGINSTYNSLKDSNFIGTIGSVGPKESLKKHHLHHPKVFVARGEEYVFRKKDPIFSLSGPVPPSIETE